MAGTSTAEEAEFGFAFWAGLSLFFIGTSLPTSAVVGGYELQTVLYVLAAVVLLLTLRSDD